MQPRERLHKNGADSLSDVDLLSLLIGTGLKDASYVEIARKALIKLRKDRESSSALYDSVLEIGGIGATKASRIVAGIELGRRLYGLHDSASKKVLDTQSAAEHLSGMKKLKQEHVRALFLNARFELLADKLLAVGQINQASITPREILSPALEVNAINIILAHNHPSGEHEPSEADISLTKRVKDACDVVGVRLLDHLVIAESGWSSVIL